MASAPQNPTEPDPQGPVTPDPIELQVMAGAMRAIAEEMGALLIRAAHSSNIKERRDCSTAIFDASGEMVVQAEHIPVHLGSMPDAVAAVLGEEQRPDSGWILNDPYRGGTHLPDITMIHPVFSEDALIGFTASRAHHADVGGPTPGSMPAGSTRLDEEGVVIPPTRIEDGVLEDLAGQMRSPRQRLADLRAQRAANNIGAERLLDLVGRLGVERLRGAMAEILDYSERRMRAALAELPDGERTAEDVLEGADGSDIQLRVSAAIDGEELRLDFSGSANQVEGNLNCPLSVTRSAALFAVRVLTDPDAPPSAGAYRPISVTAPEGSLLNARPPAAVAAGNVETSSRVADLVMAALGAAADAPAQGQGTMNNLTLAPAGEDSDDEAGWTYYETVGGGQGACPTADGPSAVHVAMSNTLITPVEALELSYPLRVERWELREGSGGAGAHRGGDGVVRELRVLEDCRLSVLAERRAHGPHGAEGGTDGAPGRTLVNGEEQPAKMTRQLHAGDVVRIETPGGGGFGARKDPEE